MYVSKNISYLQKPSPNIPSKIRIIPIKEESSLGCCPLTAMMKRLTWSQVSRSLNTNSAMMLASVSLEGSSKPKFAHFLIACHYHKQTDPQKLTVS